MREDTNINFHGQEDTETRIAVQDSIIIPNQNINIRSSLNFRNGIFRFELGNTMIESTDNFQIEYEPSYLIITVGGDSVTVKEEKDNEEEEELNTLPSPTLNLNNNINIVPTPQNDNSPNNVEIGGTFGGGSGF